MEQRNCCKNCGGPLNSILDTKKITSEQCLITSITEDCTELQHNAERNAEECSKNINANIYGNVQISNSHKVIIGNVTYITGPVHITQVTSNIEEQTITNQLFVIEEELNNFQIVPRENWMASPPKELTPLPETVQYVIIAHTASEAGYNQPQNALLVKLIQTFHVESRKWDDISYNFLVGCDGNIYEGRGWRIQGAHTYGYNTKSICIAFIGCFMDCLPPVSALNAARKLIATGVKLGFIPKDYTLIGHCQASPIESPGVQLFNVIKKWPNWRELTPEDSK